MKNGKRKSPGRAVRAVTAVLTVIFAAAVPAAAADDHPFRVEGIAGTSFGTLTAAVNKLEEKAAEAVEEGNPVDESLTKIYMTGDWTITGEEPGNSVELKIGRNLTLDLKGFRLIAEDKYLAVQKAESAGDPVTLTVTGPGTLDSAAADGGEVTLRLTGTLNLGCAAALDGGTLEIGDGAKVTATGGISGMDDDLLEVMKDGFLQVTDGESRIVLENGEVIVPPDVSDKYGYTVIDNSSGGTCDLTGGGRLSVGIHFNEDNALDSKLVSVGEDDESAVIPPQTWGELITASEDGGRLDGIYETNGEEPSRLQAAADGRSDPGNLFVAQGTVDLTVTASDENPLQVAAGEEATVTVNGRTVPKGGVGLTVGPCTVSYAAGEGGSGDMEQVSMTAGETLTLPECAFTAPAGKVFDRWNVSYLETDRGNHAPGEEITVDGDTAVTALWKDAPAPATPATPASPSVPSGPSAAWSYAVTSGDGAVWNGGTGGLVFRVNADLEKFLSVRVDGTEVARSRYTVRRGSTVVTLKSAYLKTLAAGTHVLDVSFTDGAASAVFRTGNNPDTGGLDAVGIRAALRAV